MLIDSVKQSSQKELNRSNNMNFSKDSLSIFGLSSEDIWCHDRGIDIAFKSMNIHLYNYFSDMGFKLYQRNGYKVLSLRRKPKVKMLTIKEAYNLI